jgi:hypothetical protein
MGKKTKTFTLKRKHFKKKLSNELGFGYQDLKKKPKNKILKLYKKGYEVKFKPIDIPNMVIKVTAKK